MTTNTNADWKCGNEFLPYHPGASHVEPAYRDGWNDCYRAALTTAAAVPVEQRLDDIEQYRMQMAGICTASIGYWKAGDSVHPDYDTPALREVAALYEKYDELFQRNSALADWVASRWRDEVANRPLINKSRRPLDDTWRQVLRHLGVDDEARLGPRHDDLLAAAPKAEPVPTDHFPDAGKMVAQPALWDEKKAVELFESARAGSNKPVGVLRGIRAVIAAWEGAQPAVQQGVPSPTTGMTLAQRILHVGGRNNAAGYVEFGSTQAVEALVRQVIRDLPPPAHPAAPAAQGDAEDAARLDFMIEHRAYVVSDPDACPGYWLHFVHKETGRTWVQGDEHTTPRAAIDAARSQAKEGA